MVGFVHDLLRYSLAAPYVVYSLAQCGAYGVLWTSWRLATLLLPHKVYLRGEEFLFEKYQQLIIFFVENIGRTELVLYGDYEHLLSKKENVIWISNHQSAADWIVCEMLALKQGSLQGVRYILKDTIKYIPLFGWYFPQHSCVFVRRSRNEKDIKDIAEQMDIYPKYNMPLWLVIFPEGTRYDPRKTHVIKKSQEYAKELGLEVLKHHLTPRVKATSLAINKLRGHCDAVYDITVGYEEINSHAVKDMSKRCPSISFTNFFCGNFKRVHLKIRRIDIREPPENEEDLQKWLHHRFTMKDQDLEEFYRSRDDSADDKQSGRSFSGPSLLCQRNPWSTASSVLFWGCASLALVLSSKTSFYIWTGSWTAILLFGPLYACYKR